jgi:hypothetical protein
MADGAVNNEIDAQDSDEDEVTGSLKNWNFPKMHMHVHMCNDIRAKGVTRNYNTKPNEQMHGPLRRSYKLRTNFKNVAPQVQICCLGDYH